MNASSLLANGSEDHEIRVALVGHMDLLCEAFDGWEEETTPLGALPLPQLNRWISEHLRGFMALTMGRYSDVARDEFSTQCAMEFAKVPVSLLDDAVAAARREISHPEKFVPFVFGFIAERQAKLESEGRRLLRLLEIGEGQQ